MEKLRLKQFNKFIVVMKRKMYPKGDHMHKTTSIKPCIIMGINQKYIARNETNYIIELLSDR